MPDTFFEGEVASAIAVLQQRPKKQEKETKDKQNKTKQKNYSFLYRSLKLDKMAVWFQENCSMRIV